MKIAVHLRHPDVPCWNWTERQTHILQRLVSNSSVCVCGATEAFCRELQDAEVAVVWCFRQEWFARAPRLRLLATPAAGKDYFRVTPPPAVTLVYGTFHGRIMAETVVGALLGMTRGFLPAATEFTADPWPRKGLALRMRSLRGSHVVILGFGHIGREIARLLSGFDVRITGIRRSPQNEEGLPASPAVAVRPVTNLHSILPSADHLVIVLPGSSETDRIIDEKALSLLPAHATVTNAGRGNAIDEAALSDCLAHGKLSGAFLDVFQEEPLPQDSPLRNCPNLWTLPHASAISPDYMDLYAEELGRIIMAYQG